MSDTNNEFGNSQNNGDRNDLAALVEMINRSANSMAMMAQAMGHMMERFEASQRRSEPVYVQPQQEKEGSLRTRIPVYSGHVDGIPVQSWLDQLKMALIADNILSEERRIAYSVGLLGDAALEWWRDRRKQYGEFVTWQQFAEALKSAFIYPNMQHALRNRLDSLRQTRSVNQYAVEFRKIMGQIEGMNEIDKVCAYVKGLKPATRREVQYLACDRLEEAIAASIRYETAMFSNAIGKKGSSNNSFNRINSYNKRNVHYQENTHGRNESTPMELDRIEQSVNAKVKCWNCDQPGHILKQCKKPRRRLQTMELNKNDVQVEENVEDKGSENEVKKNHELLRLPGTVGDGQCEAVFMIDSGATHNFMPLTLAKKYGLSVSAIGQDGSGSSVNLGDGSEISLVGISEKVKVKIKTFEDNVDFIIFPSRKEDVILGIQWLKSREPLINWMAGTLDIQMDHENKNNEHIQVTNIELNSLVTPKQVDKWIRKGQVSEIAFGLVTVESSDKNESVQCNNAEYNEINKSTTELTAQQQERLDNIMNKYKEVFSDTLAGLPEKGPYDHRIQLKDDQPTYRPTYRISPKEMEVLKKQLKEMLDLGLITPSTSPYGAPVLFVKKSDGSLRMVIDYRMLNKKTIRDRYPLPRIEDLLLKLADAKYFSKFDLKSGYYQIRVHDADIEKTAFTTPLGSYQLLVLPMGMANSAATFQKNMNQYFSFDKFGDFVVVYLDDILVYSETIDEHFDHIEKVLDVLKQKKFRVSPSKSQILVQEVVFCGNVIANGIKSVESKRADAIMNIPRPSDKKQLRSFCGAVNYIREFLPGVSELLSPLTKLTSSKVKFIWTDEQEEAFNKVKTIIASRIELMIPNTNKPFRLETDASDVAIAGVLFQQDDSGKWCPCSVVSRKLNAAEKNYPTHEKEMLAIVWSFESFRHLVEGVKVEVLSDHAGLRFFETQANLSRRMARWSEKMCNYDYEIKYKSGQTNQLADLLSRPSENSAAQSGVSVSHIEEKKEYLGYSDWLEMLKQGSAKDLNALELEIGETNWPLRVIDYLTGGEDALNDLSTSFKEFIIREAEHFDYDRDNQLFFRKMDDGSSLPFVPWASRVNLVHQVHVGSGHLRADLVADRMVVRVWWPAMKADIKKWLKYCEQCQVAGNFNNTPREFIHPMVPANKPFYRWGLDFIGPLPESEKGNRWILVAVDHMTRWPILKALVNATSENIAQFLYSHIVVNYGCPMEVLTDRGKNFCSDLLEDYMGILKIKHLRTSAYHPRTNGMVESLNGQVGRMIMKLCGGARHKWDQFIDQVMFNLRVRKHDVTGFSPFFLVYGFEPVLPGDEAYPFALDDRNPRDVAEIRARILDDMGAHRQAAWERTGDSHDRMKLRYDKLVKEDPLHVGEWVLLQRGNRLKFESKWVGPFKIHRVGAGGVYKSISPEGVVKEDWVHRDRMKRCQVDPNNTPTRFWSDVTLDEYDVTLEQHLNGQGSDDLSRVALNLSGVSRYGNQTMPNENATRINYETRVISRGNVAQCG